MRHSRKTSQTLGTLLAAVGFTVACVTACRDVPLPADVQAALDALPEKVAYTYDVKPILSDRCFACLGRCRAWHWGLCSGF